MYSSAGTAMLDPKFLLLHTYKCGSTSFHVCLNLPLLITGREIEAESIIFPLFLSPFSAVPSSPPWSPATWWTEGGVASTMEWVTTATSGSCCSGQPYSSFRCVNKTERRTEALQFVQSYSRTRTIEAAVERRPQFPNYPCFLPTSKQQSLNNTIKDGSFGAHSAHHCSVELRLSTSTIRLK